VPRRSAESRLARLLELVRVIARCFRDHELLTYASAIAFRALVALVPLTLLGIALLGALGRPDVWHDSISPRIEGAVSAPVYGGIDYSAERILESGTAGIIAFAAALLVWDLVWAVFAVMRALNRIHDVGESRPLRRRVLVAVGLAVAVGLCLLGSVLVLAAAAVLGLGRWAVTVLLLVLAVGLLVRYAPAERPEVRWASAGSVLVIGTWIVASLGFRWYVASVANFETAVGTLTVFLVLTAYLLTSSAIFLVGAQLDELLRADAEKGEAAGVVDLLRGAFGR
jgi:membrane protein